MIANFFSTSGFNIYDTYITLANNNDIVKFRPLNYGFSAKQGSEQNINTVIETLIDFSDEAYDIGNQFSTANQTYTLRR
jgi:hypothetical protein